MDFVNVKEFKKWLQEVSRYNVDDSYVAESLKELWTQYCETGCAEYELSKSETKSGVTELYYYDVKTVIVL